MRGHVMFSLHFAGKIASFPNIRGFVHVVILGVTAYRALGRVPGMERIAPTHCFYLNLARLLWGRWRFVCVRTWASFGHGKDSNDR